MQNEEARCEDGLASGETRIIAREQVKAWLSISLLMTLIASLSLIYTAAYLWLVAQCCFHWFGRWEGTGVSVALYLLIALLGGCFLSKTRNFGSPDRDRQIVVVISLLWLPLSVCASIMLFVVSWLSWPTHRLVSLWVGLRNRLRNS